MTNAEIVLLLIGAVTVLDHAVGLSVIAEPITIVKYQPSKGDSYRRVHSYPGKLPRDYNDVPKVSPDHPQSEALPIEDLINPRLGMASEEISIPPKQTRPLVRPRNPHSRSSSGVRARTSEHESSYDEGSGQGQTNNFVNPDDDIPSELARPLPRPSNSRNRNGFLQNPQTQPQPISSGYHPPFVTLSAHLPPVSEYENDFRRETQIQPQPLSTDYLALISRKPRPLPSENESNYELPDINKGHDRGFETNASYQWPERNDWLRPLPRPIKGGHRYRRRTEKAADDLPSAIPSFNPFK